MNEMSDLSAISWSASEFFKRFPDLAQMLVTLDKLTRLDEAFNEVPESLRFNVTGDLVTPEIEHAHDWYELHLLLDSDLFPTLRELRTLVRPTWMNILVPQFKTSLRQISKLSNDLRTAEPLDRGFIAFKFECEVYDLFFEIDNRIEQLGTGALGQWGYFFFRNYVVDGMDLASATSLCKHYAKERAVIASNRNKLSDIRLNTENYSIDSCDGQILCRLKPDEFKFVKLLFDRAGRKIPIVDMLDDLGRDNREGTAFKTFKYRICNKLKRDGLDWLARRIHVEDEHYELIAD